MIEFLADSPYHSLVFKPRTKLVAEILVLRQQLNVLRRQVSKRPHLSNTDRFLFVWLYRLPFRSQRRLQFSAQRRSSAVIARGSYWRGRSRKPVGRPRISAELRNLIGAMSHANHLWGVQAHMHPCGPSSPPTHVLLSANDRL